MTMPPTQPHPVPPVAPHPPHWLPPAQRPPSGLPPLPHSPLPAPGTHAVGYEITGTGTKSKHKTTYRVGTSQPGTAPAVFETTQQALAHLQQLLERAAAAGATTGGDVPMPTAITALVTHEPASQS